MKRVDERSERWQSLSADQRLELALALLRRPSPHAEGVATLRKLYPAAPEQMLDTASWHAFQELPRAVVDLLAELELSLREPEPYFYAGLGVDALYHLYNVFQFGALLPEGRAGLEELVQEVKECLQNGDHENALKNLESLERKLSACESAPDID